MAKQAKTWFRVIVAVAIILNVASIVCLHEFHKHGVLVEYGEAHNAFDKKRFQYAVEQYGLASPAILSGNEARRSI
jgi:hypothetical protein